MKTEIKNKVPLMYKGWLIKHVETPFDGKKFAAYNFSTDYFINPLYNTWEQLKSIIDAMK